MQFIRRIYYLLLTGEIITNYSMQNEHYQPSIDNDYEVYEPLRPYTSRRDEIGLFEWLEPDLAIEDQFARAYGVSVDMSGAKPVIVFDFTPPPEPEPVPDERDTALQILGISAAQPQAQAQAMRSALNQADYSAAPAAVLGIPTVIVDEWTPGKTYIKGKVVAQDGVKYLVMSAQVTAQAHQPPNMANGAMLSVYKPYRDAGRYPWLYGEYCPKDYEREDAGVWYRVIQPDAGANIYRPSQVPAVWTKV